jgi:murein L,D-transpeptidase YafK
MLERFRRFLVYSFKELEIRYRTWLKRREISRAYRQDQASGFRISRNHIAVAGAAVIGVALLFGIYGLSMAPETAPPANRRDSQAVQRLQDALDRTERKTSSTPARNRNSSAHTASLPASDSESVDTGAADLLETVVDTAVAPADNAYSFSDSAGYHILANKGARKMYVLGRTSAGWRIARVYPMAYGERDGPKQLDGDLRTPEGLYFIIGRKERSELHEQYGPMAFILNYPNDEDRRAGRTGQGIWIHGTWPDSMPYQTRGCLEISNQHLEDLGSLLGVGIGTPVYIIDRDSLARPARVIDYEQVAGKRRRLLDAYRGNQHFFAALLDRWRQAWESENIERYASFYDQGEFSGQGLRWEGWRERKLRTFELYDTIRVRVDKVLLTDFADSVATVKFVQQYRSDVLNVVNGKKLSFIKGPKGWKISSESTFPQEELL